MATASKGEVRGFVVKFSCKPLHSCILEVVSTRLFKESVYCNYKLKSELEILLGSWGFMWDGIQTEQEPPVPAQIQQHIC